MLSKATNLPSNSATSTADIKFSPNKQCQINNSDISNYISDTTSIGNNNDGEQQKQFLTGNKSISIFATPTSPTRNGKKSASLSPSVTLATIHLTEYAMSTAVTTTECKQASSTALPAITSTTSSSSENCIDGDTENNMLMKTAAYLATLTAADSFNTVAASPTLGINLRVTGQCSQGGRKYMEDYYSVAYQESKNNSKELEYAFFGIFDGHGGAEAALFAKEHLMIEIVKQKSFWSDCDDDILGAIREGFLATHFAMWREHKNWPLTSNGHLSTAGTTATVAFLRREKIYIGHVGDSGVVLGYQNENENFWRAKQLTTDHKPETPLERKRIQRSGGSVTVKSGVPRVVWRRPRNPLHRGPLRHNTSADDIPFLAVARSLGDLWSYNAQTKEFVVSPDPDVKVVQIDPKRFRCLIFGTDGLWNVMSAQAAVNAVCEKEFINNAVRRFSSSNNNCPNANPSKCLVEKALRIWSSKKMRADNTSVVTVILCPNKSNGDCIKCFNHTTRPVLPTEISLENGFGNEIFVDEYQPILPYRSVVTKFLPPIEFRDCKYMEADNDNAVETDEADQLTDVLSTDAAMVGERLNKTTAFNGDASINCSFKRNASDSDSNAIIQLTDNSQQMYEGMHLKNAATLAVVNNVESVESDQDEDMDETDWLEVEIEAVSENITPEITLASVRVDSMLVEDEDDIEIDVDDNNSGNVLAHDEENDVEDENPLDEYFNGQVSVVDDKLVCREKGSGSDSRITYMKDGDFVGLVDVSIGNNNYNNHLANNDPASYSFAESYNTLLNAQAHHKANDTSMSVERTIAPIAANMETASPANVSPESPTAYQSIDSTSMQQILQEQQRYQEQEGYSLTKLETRREQQRVRYSVQVYHPHELSCADQSDTANIWQNHYMTVGGGEEMIQGTQQAQLLELDALLQHEREEEQQVALEQQQQQQQHQLQQQNHVTTAYNMELADTSAELYTNSTEDDEIFEEVEMEVSNECTLEGGLEECSSLSEQNVNAMQQQHKQFEEGGDETPKSVEQKELVVENEGKFLSVDMANESAEKNLQIHEISCSTDVECMSEYVKRTVDEIRQEDSNAVCYIFEQLKKLENLDYAPVSKSVKVVLERVKVMANGNTETNTPDSRPFASANTAANANAVSTEMVAMPAGSATANRRMRYRNIPNENLMQTRTNKGKFKRKLQHGNHMHKTTAILAHNGPNKNTRGNGGSSSSSNGSGSGSSNNKQISSNGGAVISERITGNTNIIRSPYATRNETRLNKRQLRSAVTNTDMTQRTLRTRNSLHKDVKTAISGIGKTTTAPATATTAAVSRAKQSTTELMAVSQMNASSDKPRTVNMPRKNNNVRRNSVELHGIRRSLSNRTVNSINLRSRRIMAEQSLNTKATPTNVQNEASGVIVKQQRIDCNNRRSMRRINNKNNNSNNTRNGNIAANLENAGVESNNKMPTALKKLSNISTSVTAIRVNTARLQSGTANGRGTGSGNLRGAQTNETYHDLRWSLRSKRTTAKGLSTDNCQMQVRPAMSSLESAVRCYGGNSVTMNTTRTTRLNRKR